MPMVLLPERRFPEAERCPRAPGSRAALLQVDCAARPASIVAVYFASLLAHIEQAQSRQIVVREQLLMYELPLYLAQLYCAHARAVRREFSRCVLFEGHEQILGRCCS